MIPLPAIRRLLEGALDLCFPRHCFGCGDAVETNGGYRYFCARCRARFIFIDGSHCPTCGAPFFGRIPEGHEPQCPRCCEIRPVFRHGRSLFLHRGIGRAAVLELKYHRGDFLLQDLMRMTARFADLEAAFARAVFVPGPLHPRKLRERGFNQSLWIARRLAQTFPGTRVDELLQRTVDIGSQTRLSRRERLRNAKNAFAIEPKATLDASDFFVLVDDVYTTGATINACARALRRAGARHIAFFTLAHG